MLEINESDKDNTPTNSLPSSTPTHEIQSQNTEITITTDDSKQAKKNPDEESLKPGNIYILLIKLK